MFSALSYYIYLNYSEGQSQSGSNLNFQQVTPNTLCIHSDTFFLPCFDIHFFSSWQENVYGLGHKLSTLLCRQPDSPPPSALCVACLRIAPQVAETHKRRGEETLKYLNLAKINKLRYSLHIL